MTPVTVIEAGPCPVVPVRTPDADGYDAVQLAFDAGRRAEALEARGRPPDEERRARRIRHLVEFRGETRSSPSARPSPSRSFEPGDEIKVAGRHDRQGLPGTIKRHKLQPRPRLARLAQRPQAGLDRRVGVSLARVQGHEDGRAAWAARASPSAGSSSTRWTSSATCCSSGAPFRARRAASCEIGRRRDGCAQGTRDRRQGGEGRLPRGGRLRRRAQAAPRPRDGARGDERRARRARGREEPRPRRRRPLEAVAPEGHGPCSRGHDRAPHWTGGGVVFAPRRAASTSRSTEEGRKRARCAPRSAPRRATARSRSSTVGFRDAVDEGRAELLARLGRPADARSSSSSPTTRPPVQVVPQPREACVIVRGRARGRAIVWARSLLVTQAALPLERLQEARAG